MDFIKKEHDEILRQRRPFTSSRLSGPEFGQMANTSKAKQTQAKKRKAQSNKRPGMSTRLDATVNGKCFNRNTVNEEEPRSRKRDAVRNKTTTVKKKGVPIQKSVPMIANDQGISSIESNSVRGGIILKKWRGFRGGRGASFRKRVKMACEEVKITPI